MYYIIYRIIPLDMNVFIFKKRNYNQIDDEDNSFHSIILLIVQ